MHYLPAGWQLHMDGKNSLARGRLEGHTDLSLEIDAVRSHLTVFRLGATEHVFMGASHHALLQVDPLTVTPAAAAGPTGLRSPMPGRVIELIAQAGQRGRQGSAIAGA